MPSSKRTKEETWTEAELMKALQKEDDEPKRSDGKKKRSSGEKAKKPVAKAGDAGSKKERPTLPGVTAEKKRTDSKTVEGGSHRKHKEKEKHRSDGDKLKSDGAKRKSDVDKRKSDGDKKKSDGDKRKSDGDKRKSDRERRKSDVDKHKPDVDRHRSETKEPRHSNTVYDQEVLENRSVERNDKRQKRKESLKDSASADVKKRPEKDAEEHSSRGKENKRHDKERKHRSSDKEERKLKDSSKERQSHRKDSGHRYMLNETFDVDSPSFDVNAIEKEVKRKDEVKINHKTVNNDLAEKKSSEKVVSEQLVNTATENKYNYDDDEFDDYDDDFEEEDGDESGNNMNNSGDNNSSDSNSDAEEHVISDIDDNSDKDNIVMSSNKENQNKASVEINILRGKQRISSPPLNEEVSNMSELLKAISAENERVSSNASSRSGSRPSTGTEKMEERLEKASESPKFSKKPMGCGSPKLAKKVMGKINFVAASQKQINEKTARKTKKRGQELLQLIQLDQRHIDLFEMPPMTEYELYMKRFGKSGYTQMYTQTRDDDVSQNTQTDDIEAISRWSQCSHDMKSCGTDDDKHEYSKHTSGPLNINTVRLNAFIQKAGQVFLSLFNEIEAGIDKPHRQYTESKTSFSDGYVTLTSADFLVLGRSFSHLSYSPSQTNMLLAAYGEYTVTRPNKAVAKGIISVWNTNDPTRPSAYLVCESVPRSCCFASSVPSLVFAGMEDGVICVWDLREPSSYHKTVSTPSATGDTLELFRTATFTTAALKNNHEFPVVAVSPILSSSDSSTTHNNGEIDMSFQLISLDQGGTINIWIVVEVHIDLSDISNVHEDLGLSPIGCIKLAQSGTIKSVASSFSATCVQVDVTRPNHVYIGTDEGNIVHALRFGSRPIPKTFKPPKGGVNKVNAIDVSPWKMPYFLVCYEDGSISLFHNQRDTALRTWEAFSNGESIVNVRWSCSKPNILFAMDAQSVLYIWDIFQSDMDPILKQQIKRKDKMAIGFSLANDYSSLGSGTPGRAAEMVFMYGDGSIEMHRLSKNLANMGGDELDRIQDYLDEIIVT